MKAIADTLEQPCEPVKRKMPIIKKSLTAWPAGDTLERGGYMNTGEKVRMLRLKAELSQRDLAKIAQTSHGTIARIESGAQPNPPSQIMKAIAEKFRVSIEDLLNPAVGVSDVLALSEKKRPKKSPVDSIPLKNLLHIPVVAHVSCGMPTDIPEEMIMDYISLPYAWVRDKEPAPA